LHKALRAIQRLPSPNSVVICGVLQQPSVPGLRIAKLLLEYAERMFNLGADAGLQAFNLVEYRVQTIVQAGIFSCVLWPQPEEIQRANNIRDPGPAR
jgi:hypothetical protein